MDKLEKFLRDRNEQIHQIDESLERWHRKLTRAVTAIDKLRAAKKRLLKPRKLQPHEINGSFDSKDWHKIREQDFGDEIPDFLRRV